MLRNKIKRVLIGIAAVFVMMFSLLPVSAFADVEVATRRDDVYNQLFAAATVNVLANTLKKCIPSIVGPGSNSAVLDLIDSYGITSSEVRSGSVFTTGVFGVATEVTTALWVENATQGKSDNGSIYCYQEDGKNILIQFVKAINEISGTNVSVTDLMCNGGAHRLVQRGVKTFSTSGAMGDMGTYTYSLADDRNCNSFTDSDGIWLRADDAATQFKNYYNTWRASNVAKNPFLPTYDELGKFNNVDGYFTYLEDFNQHCRAAAGIKASDRELATDYYGVTKYSKDDRKITARKLYYHLSSNKTWANPLSTDNSVTSCSGLLERVETLRTTSNGLPINGRTGGYENILLAELDGACKNAKTSEGNNGWAELKTKLTEVINDPDATDEAKEKAQENLDKLNDVVNNNKYIESSGSEDSDDGKVYQCVSIDGLDIDVDDYNVPSVVPDPGTTEPSTIDPNEGETVCKANAGVLGWILCPIIKAISGIGEHMWNQVEQNHLKIQAREMFVNNTGVKDAFDVVRNISNIAFIILFMFVIFSQLTGVGIDNYGIKRILPRLIMVAILTNLSYYICEAAVDISNIFGAGLNDMLTGFANNIGYGRDSMGALAGGLAIDGILAGGGIAIFLTLNPVTATGAVMGAISVAFAVFGVIVSIVAAMLVLYLIVVIREAAIIIMVVLAPVAIVCYALPNTEKIYKRWFDIFKALLIVYPICGAMVGAGRLAAAVLGQINTQSMAIAAMIVQVIPFFLIPMLLKNSLAALGNIGAKISNAGRSLSRRASGAVTNGIRNSARFKDFEQFQKDKTTAARAGRVAKALENRARKRGGVENLSLRDQDRLAKAHAAQEARKAYEKRTKMGAREDYHEFREKNMDAAFDSERGKMYAQNFEYETDRSRLEDAFDSGIDGADAEYAVAAMEALINRGGIKEAMNIVRKKKNFDWNSDMGKRLAQAMGGTNVDAFQAYSKYRGKGGKVGFDDWLRGADHGNKNIKEVSSYADHLRARGVKSMAKYSKDEMEFIKDNYSAISAGMGTAEREEFRGDLAGMVNWAAINSDDAKVSRMAEQVLTQELTYGTEDVSGNKTYGISSVRDLGLTAGSIGQMKGTTMQAILKGYEQRIASNQEYAPLGQEKITELAMQALRNDLAPQIKAIESDVRIKNNTSGDVLSILGIRGGPNDIPDTSVPLRQETPTPKPNNSPAPSSNDGWYFDNYGGGSKT